MNGYVSSPTVVLNYINKINLLFQDEQYLLKQQKKFDEVNIDFAFTEMKAYKEYKISNEKIINTIRLNSIIDGSTFDDCICQQHDMEMEILYPGKKIKKVHCSKSGKFYCYNKSNNMFIEMNSLNLSWVPIDLFDIVLNKYKKSNKFKKSNEDISQTPTLGEIYNQYNNRISRKFKSIFKKTKKRICNRCYLFHDH